MNSERERQTDRTKFASEDTFVAFKESVEKHYATKTYVLSFLLTGCGSVILMLVVIIVRLLWFAPTGV